MILNSWGLFLGSLMNFIDFDFTIIENFQALVHCTVVIIAIAPACGQFSFQESLWVFFMNLPAPCLTCTTHDEYRMSLALLIA